MANMMDVGWGELLLLAVAALLIFGPEKLPKAAADAGRMVRKLREMASSAQKELSPGLDVDGIKKDLKSVADLHPKRIMSSALSDATAPLPASTPTPVTDEEQATDQSTAPVKSRKIDPDAT